MDDWVAKYDGEVASLLMNNRKIGMLFLDAHFWIQVQGPMLRRRKKQLVRLEWSVAFTEKGGRLHVEDGLYESEAETAELDRGMFTYKGEQYSLEWLDPEDIDRVRYEFARAEYKQLDDDLK